MEISLQIILTQTSPFPSLCQRWSYSNRPFLGQWRQCWIGHVWFGRLDVHLRNFCISHSRYSLTDSFLASSPILIARNPPSARTAISWLSCALPHNVPNDLNQRGLSAIRLISVRPVSTIDISMSLRLLSKHSPSTAWLHWLGRWATLLTLTIMWELFVTPQLQSYAANCISIQRP